MSGAGSIKGDAVDEHTVLEIKDAHLSYTLTSAYLKVLHHEAVIQGKEPRMLVRFTSGMEAEIIIRKRRPT